MDETGGPWMRLPLGPGCTAVVLMSREPSGSEVALLIKFLQIAIEDPYRPTVVPPPAESA